MTLEVTIEDILAAQRRLGPGVADTPLVPLAAGPDDTRVLLKLENLGPIGSFKLRGATNALAGATLDDGVYTASAGNMAQAVAWVARERGVPCTVVVPDHAPAAKQDAVRRLGADIVTVPFDEWWQIIVDHEHPAMSGRFVHPVCDPAVIAGNGTAGVEIIDAVPDVDTVVVPYGGGGLSSGIATALRTLAPEARVVAAEIETAAPFAAALEAGGPVAIDHRASWVDGIGSGSVLDEMWPTVSNLLSGSVVVSHDEAAEALRLVVSRNNVVPEGAGAAAVAAALSGRAGTGTIVCVVSGGNIDAPVLARILEGETPT